MRAGFATGRSFDSGSDWCLFDALVGAEIGLEVETGEKREFAGVSENAGFAYFHSVMIRVGDFDFEIRVGFVDNFRMPYGLLGRAGFFDRFVVTLSLATAMPFVDVQALQ